ncbi:probable glutamate/gamma-aminobutyrate antiporter [Lentilactobacillus farraginis DSM 18382 = JCM 14108]|uniref:Probable glutamate/gamma-aminobutyrate antiporter n=1 Tax=Lentilactobacillus farraginis DSM 18382 = JCM 14108 TaxID=1423743 RepID=X0PCE6_9LACO|nr:probable glutamate/gamma-aminobutyrate antiporter [Lentilactobacillus farraginis DSM 18382 = JCM 14108]
MIKLDEQKTSDVGVKKSANQINGFQLFSMTTSMVMTVYGFAALAKQGR